MTHESRLIVLNFDAAVYRLDAIKKAIYRLSGKYDLSIRVENDRQIVLTCQLASDTTDLASVRQEIQREVTDQELREVIREETTGVRNVLMAHAFSGLPLAGSEPNCGVGRDQDPEKIRGVDEWPATGSIDREVKLE